MKPIKVTSKGQVTIPVEIRSSLGIEEHSYVEVSQVDDEIRMRTLVSARPLSADDPIWGLIGSASREGGAHRPENHDRRLALPGARTRAQQGGARDGQALQQGKNEGGAQGRLRTHDPLVGRLLGQMPVLSG